MGSYGQCDDKISIGIRCQSGQYLTGRQEPVMKTIRLGGLSDLLTVIAKGHRSSLTDGDEDRALLGSAHRLRQSRFFRSKSRSPTRGRAHELHEIISPTRFR